MRVLRVRGAFLCALVALTCCSAVSVSRRTDAGNRSLPAPAAAPVQQAQETHLRNAPDSLKFAVIGDNGTGDPPQYDIAKQMLAFHEKFPFTFVVMMGDNIYGSVFSWGRGPARG